MLRRRYITHRHAYTPRLWPLAVPTCIFAFGLSMLVGVVLGMVGSIASVVLGLVVGIGAVQLRWHLWRRRHPETPCGPRCVLWMTYEMERRAPAQRETARWQ